MRFSRIFVALSCSASALAMPATAFAQTAVPGVTAAETAPPEAASGLDDIVVTAQKGARGESVQRVPIAVTAVSGAMIANMHAVNLMDVAQVAPNVNFTGAATLPGFANFFIRGIGISGSTSSIDPAVNVVVDGMVYDFQGGTILDAFDLDSIEILRGPQGILFGRNTTGGAVSLRTRRPTNDFNADAEITVGNYDRIDVSAMVRGPIVKDSLLGKITVLYRSRDGYVKDNNGGTFVAAPLNPSGVQPASPKGTVGDVDMLAIRPSLTWTPTDNLDINLLGEYVRMNGGGSYPRIRPGFDALLQSRFGYTPPTKDWQSNLNVIGFTRIRAPRLVGEVNWDVGIGKVTSVTGYRHVNYQFSFDDGTPFVIIEFPRGNEIKSEQYSEELRFASTFSDVVDFVVGGYYDHHTLDIVERRIQANLVAAPTAPT
ncbi:MAG: TonB-dependent receptor [Rhizorhabdus sp.]|nr:TonB-dependent receptor [Rhizorhabdus sp.]